MATEDKGTQTPPAEPPVVTAGVTPPAEPPPGDPPPFDAKTATLSDWRKKKKADAAGETPTETPPGVTPPVQAVPPPEEGEDDPVIQAEIDKAEPPKPEETPQDRAARTKRNRRKAQAAYATRVTRERDEARQKVTDLEARFNSRRQPPVEPPAEPPGSTYDGTDPKDPAPKGEQFQNDHDYFKASVAYEVRVQNRIARHEHQQERARTSTVERERAASQDLERRTGVLQNANAEFGKTHSDFDETTKDVVYGPDIIFGVVDLEEPSAVLYHLAKHPEELSEVRRLFETNPRSAMARLGRLEAGILAARQTPPKPSTAPPPPEQTISGRQAASSVASEKPPSEMNLADWRRAKAKREAAIGT